MSSNGVKNGHGRAPLPHNLDAEASVLGGILLRNDVIELLPDLEVEDFYDHRHKVIFQAMRDLRAAGRPIDVVTVETEIERFDQTYETHKLEAIGGVAYLGELALRVPTVDNVVAYADTIRLHHRHRKALLVLSSALERARTWAHEPEELISEVAGELTRIEVNATLATRATRQRWAVPLEDYIGDQEPDDNDAEDWIIRDVVPRGEPALWGGPMKGGKTWGALDLCITVALGDSWLGKFENTLGGPAKVLGVFLEDNKRRLRKRLWELCRWRGLTPNNHILREHLRLSRASLRLPDTQNQRRFIAEIKTWGASFVVVDNLTRVLVGDQNSTRDAAAFTSVWTEIGEETGASIMFLHHMKKPPGDGATIDPFDMFRGSGDFGAAARNMIATVPIRKQDSPDKLSEVRMRGNLDLRRESFTLAFERKEIAGRWQAWLSDRGDIEKMREEVKREQKDAKERQRRDTFAAEQQKRRNLALTIAKKEGSVSGQRLASELALKSPRAVADVLQMLVSEGQLVVAGKRGYELPDADRQEGLGL